MTLGDGIASGQTLVSARRRCARGRLRSPVRPCAGRRRRVRRADAIAPTSGAGPRLGRHRPRRRSPPRGSRARHVAAVEAATSTTTSPRPLARQREVDPERASPPPTDSSVSLAIELAAARLEGHPERPGRRRHGAADDESGVVMTALGPLGGVDAERAVGADGRRGWPPTADATAARSASGRAGPRDDHDRDEHDRDPGRRAQASATSGPGAAGDRRSPVRRRGREKPASGEVDEDVLGLRVQVEGAHPELAPDARHLVAAERRLGVDRASSS